MSVGQKPKAPPVEKKLPLIVSYAFFFADGEWFAYKQLQRGDRIIERTKLEADVKPVLPRSRIILQMDRDLVNDAIRNPEL